MNTKRAFVAFVALLITAGLGTCTWTSLSYSATCAYCLQKVSGVEKSVFGIRYYHKEVPQQGNTDLMSPAIFDAPSARVEPRLYKEITGQQCAHAFIRGGFCRSTFGMVACGSSGGHQYDLRYALIANVYRAYLRVSDKTLGRESFALVDELCPLAPDRRNEAERLSQIRYAADAFPNDPRSILMRGLALVTTQAEWRQVLTAARERDNSIAVLESRELLTQRLEHPDLAVRIQAIQQLAAMENPEAWNALRICLRDRQVREIASQHIASGKYFPLYDETLAAEENSRSPESVVDPALYVPHFFDRALWKLSPAEIRMLLADQKPRLNRIAFAAIQTQMRFEFLDEVVQVNNRKPSPAGMATIERLATPRIPSAFPRASDGKSAKDPWESMKTATHMAQVEAIPNYIAGAKDKYAMLESAVHLGSQPSPENWPKLRELYLRWVNQGGSQWCAAGIAEAMAECDRSRTLDFLSRDLIPDYINMRRASAATVSLGMIADETSSAALQEYRDQLLDRFEANAYYREFLEYALQRCRGIHRLQLIKSGSGSAVIQRTVETAPPPH